MPKLFGVKLLPLIIATLVFWVIGFVWYGVVFSDAWMAASGISEGDFQSSSPAWMGLGILIPFLSAFVIAKALQWSNAGSIGSAVQVTILLWFGFGLTMALYTLAYTPGHSMLLFAIDASHLLVGWVAAGVVLAAMK